MAKVDNRPKEKMQLTIEFADNGIILRNPELEDDATPGTNVKRWWFHTPREAFAALINRVSGPHTWDCNPWVIAYTFELVD